MNSSKVSLGDWYYLYLQDLKEFHAGVMADPRKNPELSHEDWNETFRQFLACKYESGEPD